MQVVANATLEAQIAGADAVFEQVLQEEQARSELIPLVDVTEEDPYRSLRTGLRDIESLAGKIKQRGQLVPILVWLRRGRYVLLSGHRRVAALRHLAETHVKAIVYSDRDLTVKDALDIAIDDNVDRNNFSKAEMAALVARMVDEGVTQRKIAKRLRLSNGTVSDYFRLHSAPQDIRDAVDSGRVAIRAGLKLAEQAGDVRVGVLASADSGMLSLGDIKRALAGERPADRPRRVARRGAAWSRESALVAGMAWQRERDGERELRIRIPAELSPEQRQELRTLLLQQVRSL